MKRWQVVAATLATLMLAAPVERIATASDAAVIAWEDLKTLPKHDRPFAWYVLIAAGSHNDWQPGVREDRQAVAFAINATARRGNPVKYVTVTPWLIRYDLRAIAPRLDDLGDWLQLREDFRFDPSFSVLLTPDARKINRLEVIEVRRFFLWKIPTDDGYRWEMQPEVVKEAKGVVRLNGPLPAVYAQLQDAMLTEAPIVDSRYLVTRLLTTIQDQGGSSDVFGGRYYAAAGIRRARQGTDEDLLLRGLGVLKEDENATRFFEALGSEARVGMFRSKVTEKPRRVDFLPTRRAESGSGVSDTHDPTEGDRDLTKHPMYALLDLKDAARELIASRANGLHLFALFNAAGKLQDEAPFNVVSDSKIPGAHTKRLQPAISCIRCHGPHDGIQPVTNDVQALSNRGAKVFAAFELKGDVAGTLDLLQQKYAADPALLIRNGRANYNGCGAFRTSRLRTRRDGYREFRPDPLGGSRVHA